MPGKKTKSKNGDSVDTVTPEGFARAMADVFPAGTALSGGLAVGVSGGPDSLALCFLLHQWASEMDGPEIYALSVDHGLRPESAQEAEQVRDILSGWKRVRHHILCWEKEEAVASRVQEQARAARYALMAGYMKSHGLRHLFLAHHRDDQAETLLFRLAKGSGLDGLAGMARRQPYKAGAQEIELCRPLLDTPKAALVKLCEENAIPFIYDPSNESLAFARVRLRGAMDVLAAEGLTPARLGCTAERLRRAKEALDSMAGRAFSEALLHRDTNRTVLCRKALDSYPEEIALRAFLLALEEIGTSGAYGPRLDRVEAAFFDLRRAENFRRRTLGGVVIARNDKDAEIVLTREKH